MVQYTPIQMQEIFQLQEERFKILKKLGEQGPSFQSKSVTQDVKSLCTTRTNDK